jgi:hypothetical protein
MKTGWKIGLGIVGAVVLVVVGLSAGWLLWGHRVWAVGMMGNPAPMWNSGNCGSWGMMGRGPGTMYRDSGWDDNCPMAEGYTVPSSGQISIEDAQDAIEHYIKDWNTDLEIAELMEFEENFYAIVREHDTGIGAMELLVDKTTGIVGPEMGPNMMWNARYGMHRRGGMMGQSSGENSISEERAVDIAQRWLDENKPGVTVEEHADPFYGYYTIHTVKDGDIEGMLSVHGTTGQVWYHTWHGAFIQMIESKEGHS